MGSLFEGKIVYDKTYGHVTYGCGMCCGYSNALLDFNPLGIPFGDLAGNTVSAQDGCSGVFNDVSSFFYNNWRTANPSIATVDAYGTHRGVAVGATTSSTHGYLERPAAQGGPSCPTRYFAPGGGDNVAPTVTISGPQNIPMLQAGAQGSDSITVTATGNPSGGTYSWTAVSGSSNIRTLNATSQSAILQSVAVGTYTVQVTYTVNNQSGTATIVGRVQQPGSLSVPTGGDTGFVYDFNCRNTPPDYPPYTAGTRRITYQVLDTAGQPIPATGMTAVENFSPGSNNCVHTAYPSATLPTATSSNGTFGPDALGHLCSISCLPADNSDHPLGSCTLAVQQTWAVNGFNVRIKNVTYTCQSVTLQ